VNRDAATAAILVLGANLMIALGTAAVRMAYASGDASGIQYIFLSMGAIAAGIGVVLLMLSLRAPPVPRLALAPAVPAAGAVILAFLPQLTGFGYDGSRLDGPGTLLATGVLVLHAPLAVLSLAAALRTAPGASTAAPARPWW
jgi:hypothetical protein